MNNKISAVILDWAGTTIDFGCQLPVVAFANAFKTIDLDIPNDLIRRHMGLAKREHIEQVLSEPEIIAQFVTKHHRKYNVEDLDNLLAVVSDEIVRIAPDYSILIPGTIDFQDYLHENSIKIATNTGYTRKMMEPILAKASEQGFNPDLTIGSDEIAIGRPNPQCCYLISSALNCYPLSNMVKIGDNPCDIAEGKNACMWTIGVAATSNMLGLTEKEFLSISDIDKQRLAEVKNVLHDHGANFVIDGIWQASETMDKIQDLINNGISAAEHLKSN